MEEYLVRKILQRCEEHSERSTCNKRHVAAALVLPDAGKLCYAINGPEESCCEKGPDYCIREQGPGVLNYLTCPSPCAEGRVILTTMEECDVRGGIIISTDFPCERCASIIADSGIAELYFGRFKNGQSRPRDWQYIISMTESGVSVNRVLPQGIQHYDNEGVPWSFRHAVHVSGDFFAATMHDPQLREEWTKIMRNFRH